MKKTIEIAKKQNLNWQTIVIEEAQTDLKLEVKKYVNGTQTYLQMQRKAKTIINEAIKDLESPELKITARATLTNFIRQLLQKAFIGIGIPLTLMVMAFSSLQTGVKFQTIAKTYSTVIEEPATVEIAQPLQLFGEEYKKKVEKVYRELAKAEPMYDKGISLRNIAEMTVRYDRTMSDIQSFINRGVNLVVSSSHANCSKRCEAWQGGHYTLDNTYQYVDGIEFQPLKNATDQYYTTKSGKVYKNGHITGYNCRHYLMEYKKGMRQIQVDAKTIEKQRNIDHNMRLLERQVREWKDQALLHKGEDKDKYSKAVAKAKMYNQKYIEYAKANNRAYYPSRTDVF